MGALSSARKTATRVTSRVCGQALDDGVEQGAEVGLGVEAAAEVDQGLAVVEALLVEETVDAALNAALEGIEGEPHHDDGDDRTVEAEVREAVVDHLRREADDAEVNTDERGSCQRIGDAALEDEVDVHQAVADDGPAEGEREDDQADGGALGHQAGDGDVQQQRNDVEEREGRECE